MDAPTAVTPGGATGGPENRRERRMRVLKTARIVFNGGYTVYDCRVKNLSTNGALLELANVLGIPKNFEISLDGTSARRPCTVMWRTDRLMGVSFDDAAGKAA
jgi:hypothetical protein